MNQDEAEFTKHIEPERLVLFAERELPSAEVAEIEQHLQVCEQCRGQLRLDQEALQAGIDSYRRAFSETLTPPPGGWRDFESKLKTEAGSLEERGYRSIDPEKRARWVDVLLTVRWPWLTGAVVAVAIALVVLRSQHTVRITPSAIFGNAEVAQKQEFQSIQDPVIYQKVSLKAHSTAEVPLTLESWIDVSASRARQTSGGWSSTFPLEGQAQTKPDANAPPIVRQLKAVYRENRLTWATPISLNEFSKWRSSAPTRSEDETVAELHLANGDRAYRIRTGTTNTGTEYSIRAIEIIVRERDWHPVAENLVVSGSQGTETYEIAELDYKVMPSNQFGPSFWGDVPGSSAHDRESHSLPTLGTPANRELLIDILSRLDHINALTQEQIAVNREANQGLIVRGVTTNEDRKAQLLAALGPSVVTSSAVKVDITSAVDGKESQPGSAPKPFQTQSIDVSPSVSSGNADLREYLEAQKHLSGTALEQAMDHYASVAVDLSIQTELHSLALRQIVNAVPSGGEATLGPKATEQWRSMVLRHAEEIGRDATDLRDQLAPMLQNSRGEAAATPAAIPGMTIQAVAARLTELTTRNNEVLWDAFAVGATDAARQKLTDPSFRRSLDVEIQLANAIRQKAFL